MAGRRFAGFSSRRSLRNSYIKSAGISLFLFHLCAGTGRAVSGQDPPWVLRMEVHGAITPPMSEYVCDGIAKAETQKAAAVLLELDTPGGLLDSTREIVQAMLNSPVPMIVYTAPQGARSTSAGVFIMMAADVAAMSPGTHLGAAHPVSIGGGIDPLKRKPGDSSEKRTTPTNAKENSKGDDSASVMGEKAVSDAAAYIRSLATDKGRNAAWAERAVRESVSLTSKEALAQGVIEIVAADRQQLFKSLDGREISKRGRKMIISLNGAVVREYPMGTLRKILQIIANPNLLMIFMMLGIYGLMYEFSSPGVGFGAVVGVVSLILAAYAMSILPVNYAGLLLILLSIVLLGLEFQMPTHGLLAVGGLTLLTLGSLFLFDTTESYLRVSLKMIAATVAFTGAFFFFVIGKLLESGRLEPTVGARIIIGRVGEARETLDPRGMVFVNGALWSAEAASRLDQGTRVKVLEMRGSTLLVEKLEEVRHD